MDSQIIYHKIVKLSFVTMLMLSTCFAWAQCPTIISGNQVFCDTELATVGSLQAQDNGGGVVWYSSQNSIIPLQPFQPLTNGTTYFVDDNTSSCPIRESVTVTILSAPVGPNFQGFCVQDISEATVSNLIALGVGIQWFLTPNGGTPLDQSTVLSSGSIYFASQTNPQTGCLTSRLAVFVTIGLVEAPTGEAIQTICFDDPNNPPTVSDLIASGDNNWYISENATIPLNPITPLVDGQTYYATTTTPPCESEDRLAVTVDLLPANDAGESSIVNFCESLISTDGSFNLLDLLGETPSPNGTWTGDLGTTNGGLGSLNYSQLSLTNSPFEFTYTVQDNNLCPIATSTVTIQIDEFFTPGDDFSFSICSNEDPVDLFSLIPGNPSPNGVWSPALSSGTNIFDPSIDLSGVYTYTVNIGGSCPVLSSNVTITVNDTPDAGESNTVTICNDLPPFELTSLLLGTPELTGTWSPALASGTNIFDPMIDISGTYTYTILSNSSCPDSFSILNITIETAAYAGEDAIAEVCDNDAPFDLRTLLGGNPDDNGTWTPALASGTNTFIPSLDNSNTYTYTVIGNASCGNDSASIQMTVTDAPDAGISSSITLCLNDDPIEMLSFLNGTPDQGGIWTPALANPGFFDPSIDLPGVYTYTVFGNGSCENAQATLNIQIEANPNAGIDTSITICENIAPFDLLAAIDGNPDQGGFWTPSLNSGTNIFNPLVVPSGIYTYTVSGLLNCTDDSSEISVTIFDVNNAGVNNEVVFCSTDLPQNLIDLLNGNPDAGGVWSPNTINPGVFDPQNDSPGLYTYTISGNGICPDVSATVSIDVVLPPFAGNDASITICSDQSPIDLSTLLGNNVDANGTWSPALASGGSILNPQVDISGIYTYTVIAPNSCGQDSAQINVNIIQAPNSGIQNSITICEGNPPVSLTNALLGNPDLNGEWTPELASGTDIFDPSVDQPGNYWYVVAGQFPCDNVATMITVSIVPELNAGDDSEFTICSSDEPFDLFLAINGEPQVGGVWSPSLNSGTGLFDPSIDNSGIYTYTIQGNEFCQDDSSTVTVVIKQEPNAGESTSATFCENDLPVNLLDLLGPDADPNGVWSPALISNSNIFDPSQDLNGTYTYTVNGLGDCPDASSTIQINIENVVDAGLSNIVSICSNESPINLFDFLIGNPDSNGVWTPTLNSNSGVFDPSVDPQGVYTYTVSGNNFCDDAFATIEVIIENQLSPGESATLELCESSETVDLFTILGGNPDLGGIWSPSLQSGSSIFNPAVDSSGDYTYTIPSTTNCDAIFSTISVTIVPNPNAGSNSEVTLCENDSVVNLFDLLGGNPDSGGVWSPALASGSGIFDPSVDSGGLYTYTLSSNIFCDTASATVLVNLIPEASAGENGEISVCQDAPSFDLTTVLGGNPVLSGSWSPELSSGTDIFNPLFDGSGVYTYTVSTPCGTSSAEVTVTIGIIPSAGTDGSVVVCANGSPINLFDSLGGFPELGGTWSPELLSGGGVFNPLLDLPGEYVYTVSSNNSCADSFATVTVSLEQPENPGVSNTITICQNSSNINLFNLLGNTATPGGSWSPVLASGNDIYNPQVDGAGVFTYTVGGTLNCNPSEATVTVNFIPQISSGVFDGIQQVCEDETEFDLFSLLDGSQTTGGIWLNSTGNIISNLINPSLLTPGTYPFVYLISNSCLSTSTVTQLQVVPLPDLIQNNIGIDTPICLGENATILVSSIPNGSYDITIEGFGANTFLETNFNLIVENGFGIINIPSSLITQPGITTFQFNSITNTLTGCNNDINNVLISLEILGAPQLTQDQIQISSICLGDNLQIIIENANQLQDADFNLQYEILGPNTFISETGTISLVSGNATFEIGSNLLFETGDFTFNVLQILNTNTNCIGSLNLSIPFTIHPLPVTLQPVIVFQNPIQCVNESNVATINFGFALPNGEYDINYSLSGAVNFNETITITVVNGEASIEIPDTVLNNSGTVVLELFGFDFFTNICGTSSVLNATQEFLIETASTPTLVSEVPTLCEEDSPTIALLFDYVTSSNEIVWYDAFSGGNIIPNSSLLQNGFTYYAGSVSNAGCESDNRIGITITIETCIVSILIPDGFSPNNDGVNDQFEIVNIRDLYPNFTIEIYNRYGNIVFKGNASMEDWDGNNNQGGIKLNDSVLPNGVYFYIINFNDGITNAKQGRVYLNR